jgi:hypothetical protein
MRSVTRQAGSHFTALVSEKELTIWLGEGVAHLSGVEFRQLIMDTAIVF